MKQNDAGILRVIAVFKFVKVCTLILAGVMATRLTRGDAGATLDRWIMALGISPGSHLVERLLATASSFPAKRFRELGLGSFIYAALFLIEGTGLWLGRRWGEWVTVGITSSLIPLEVYEIARHPSLGKIGMLFLNLAVVGYLIWRIRSGGDQSRASAEAYRTLRILRS